MMAAAAAKTERDEKTAARSGKNEEFDLNTTTTGIVFTNLSKEDLMQAMETKETKKDFARVGQIATETIVCPEGPVKNCLTCDVAAIGSDVEETRFTDKELNKGVVECVNEKTICKRGVKLSSDQCALLRQFGYKLAAFKLRLVAGWEKSTGETEVFMNEDDSEELDYGTDEEEEDRFASDGLPKSMMLPEGML